MGGILKRTEDRRHTCANVCTHMHTHFTWCTLTLHCSQFSCGASSSPAVVKKSQPECFLGSPDGFYPLCRDPLCHSWAACFKEFIHIMWQSEKLLYSSQKLKILLFPTLWIRSCGYVNTDMTSRDRHFSIKCHKCMSKPQMWSWYSDSSRY